VIEVVGAEQHDAFFVCGRMRRACTMKEDAASGVPWLNIHRSRPPTPQISGQRPTVRASSDRGLTRITA
jgi:hypothetical protein